MLLGVWGLLATSRLWAHPRHSISHSGEGTGFAVVFEFYKLYPGGSLSHASVSHLLTLPVSREKAGT